MEEAELMVRYGMENFSRVEVDELPMITAMDLQEPDHVGMRIEIF